MSMCSVARRGFYSFANKNICDERAEVRHARCAKFGGVFVNFTATLIPLFKVFWFFFSKKNNLFYLTNSPINPNLAKTKGMPKHP